jgi:CxxC-x17-CxxC domain-containing protein
MPDVEIPCIACGTVFIFSEREQGFHYQRNLPNPQRCVKCRPRKAENGSSETARHEIICDHCGRKDFVPFKPKNGRPVHCRDCHNANKSKSRF